MLEPVEREALRSVASWRTFAAGARIMEEGERADHVMVILGGQVEIRIEENGSERVVAVRGLGQLVGERAALKVSVRSATVVALEMVWALVVQTKDFAAFIARTPGCLTSCRIRFISAVPRVHRGTTMTTLRPTPLRDLSAARQPPVSPRLNIRLDIHANTPEHWTGRIALFS